jgi:heme A synthase
MLQNLHPHLVGVHDVFRWVVLVLAVAAIVIAFSGWSGRKPATPMLFQVGLLFVIAMDLELITGVLLYLGDVPILRSAFLAHGVVMVLAVACAHIGGALTHKGPTDALKYRAPAIVWTISILLMLAGISRS